MIGFGQPGSALTRNPQGIPITTSGRGQDIPAGQGEKVKVSSHRPELVKKQKERRSDPIQAWFLGTRRFDQPLSGPGAEEELISSWRTKVAGGTNVPRWSPREREKLMDQNHSQPCRFCGQSEGRWPLGDAVARWKLPVGASGHRKNRNMQARESNLSSADRPCLTLVQKLHPRVDMQRTARRRSRAN